MRDIFSQISDYKDIHPVRFYACIVGILFLIIILIVLIKIILRKKSKKKSSFKSKNSSRKNMTIFNYMFFLLICIAIGITWVIVFRTRAPKIENPSISDSEYIFGIDISHNQGKISWDKVKTSHHPIQFVFIRSTMGKDGKDKYFKENWEKAKTNGYIRGAYHYYRPGENSTAQFNNFSSVVKLDSADFRPILDIEEESKYGEQNLRRGILNWLKMAEEKYHTKPVVYTGRAFYKRYLKGYIDDYPLWIASYSAKHKLKGIEWTFHQFTEKVIVNGINENVDGDDFNGELDDLKEMCLDHQP